MKNSLILIAIIMSIVTNSTAQDLLQKTQQNKAQKFIDSKKEPSNRLAKLVEQNRKSAKNSTAIDLFKFSNSKSAKTAQKVSKSIELELDQTEKKSWLTLKIPVNETNYFELELVRNDFKAPTYKVSTSKPSLQSYQNADLLFYKGIIKNDNQSLAAVTISNNQIRIVASDINGNYVVGKKPEHTAKYVLYNDVNLLTNPEYDCYTPEESDGENKITNSAGNVNLQGECVSIYIEADFAFYQNNGSSVNNVEVYLNALFNEVETIYFNESITIAISEIFVHTAAGPFVQFDNTNDALEEFIKLRQNNFNGRLAHLVSGRNLGGGKAKDFGVLCSSSENFAVSALNRDVQAFPTYSWDVYVFAHELGHLFGSRHTHACVWNGNNTAIDGCSSFAEGTCGLPNAPSNGGTIMSYCHQNDVGINFSLGFGPQPGNFIRNNFNNSPCILECEASCNYAGDPCNFIPNSTFDTNIDTWILNNCDASAQQGICNIQNINEGTNRWDAAIYSADLCLVQGLTYRVSFDAYSDANRDLAIKVSLNEAPWDLYHFEVIDLTTNFQNHSFLFTNNFSSTSVARMELQLGGPGNSANIYMDNIVLQPEECATQNICEQVENGDFTNDLTNWLYWGMETPEIFVDQCYLNPNEVTDGEAFSWSAALTYQNLTLEQNKVYNIQFDASTIGLDKNIILKCGLDEDPWDTYLWETVYLTNKMQTFRYTFTMPTSTILNGSLEFQVGENTIPVVVDNVSFVENNCENSNYANTCIENINLEDQPDANIYQAGLSINSRAIISNGLNISYFSGDNILLYDGFDVSPNANFNAAIKNCGE